MLDFLLLAPYYYESSSESNIFLNHKNREVYE